jgi:hypothetical protein
MKFIEEIHSMLQLKSSRDVKSIKNDVQIARNCCECHSNAK